MKISEFQSENAKKQQTNNKKSSFIDKLTQQIAKEKQELTSKHSINDNEGSDNSGTKVKIIKTDLKNPIIINKKLVPPLQQFVL